MKRVHAFFIALAIVLLLSACGDSKTSPAGTNIPGTKTPTSLAADTPTPNAPIPDTPTSLPMNSPTPVALSSGLYNDQNELKKSWEELISGEKIKVEDGILSYVDENLIGTLVIDESVTGIKIRDVGSEWHSNLVGPFSGTAITKVVLPATWTEVPDYTFAYKELYISSLTAVEIPDTVTRIGEDAFANCGKLEKITLPSSLVEIGGGAFIDCRSLKKIDLPDGLRVIGWSAFYGCAALSQLVIPKSVEDCPDGSGIYGREHWHTIRIVVYSNENRHQGDSDAFTCPIPVNWFDYVTAVVEDDSPELAFCLRKNIKYEIMK